MLARGVPFFSRCTKRWRYLIMNDVCELLHEVAFHPDQCFKLFLLISYVAPRPSDPTPGDKQLDRPTSQPTQRPPASQPLRTAPSLCYFLFRRGFRAWANLLALISSSHHKEDGRRKDGRASSDRQASLADSRSPFILSRIRPSNHPLTHESQAQWWSSIGRIGPSCVDHTWTRPHT